MPELPPTANMLLNQTNNPCTVSTKYKCSTKDISAIDITGENFTGAAHHPGDASSVEDIIEKGPFLIEASPTHIAARGTARTNSARCGWQGTAQTAAPREAEIRFWPGLDENVPLPSPDEVEALFMAYIAQMAPIYQKYVGASYLALPTADCLMSFRYSLATSTIQPKNTCLAPAPAH